MLSVSAVTIVDTGFREDTILCVLEHADSKGILFAKLVGSCMLCERNENNELIALHFV